VERINFFLIGNLFILNSGTLRVFRWGYIGGKNFGGYIRA